MEFRAKYYRAMLLLFKPWREVDDLCGESLSWEAAFETFETVCGEAAKQIMKNLQVYDEFHTEIKFTFNILDDTFFSLYVH